MIRQQRHRIPSAIAVVLVSAGALALLPAIAAACPNCYGAADSTQTAGLNNAILTLLGFVGMVLGGIVSFGVHYIRRTRRLLRARVSAGLRNN